MQSRELLYGPEDAPPLTTVLGLAAQHAVLALMFAVYPLVVAHEAELSPGATRGLVTAGAVNGRGGDVLAGARRPGGQRSVGDAHRLTAASMRPFCRFSNRP